MTSIVTDYQSLVRLWDCRGLSQPEQQPRAMYAGVTRSAAIQDGFNCVNVVLKVKAHQEVAGFTPGTWDHFLAHQNSLVDRSAKAATAMHPPPLQG